MKKNHPVFGSLFGNFNDPEVRRKSRIDFRERALKRLLDEKFELEKSLKKIKEEVLKIQKELKGLRK